MDVIECVSESGKDVIECVSKSGNGCECVHMSERVRE
jgi:hypothetical protein